MKYLEKNIVVGPFQCNCRLIVCPVTGDAALIDPGDESEKILMQLESAKKTLGKPLNLKWLLHTHAHLDHIAGTRGVQEKSGARAKIAVHKDDAPLYAALKQQGQLFGMQYDDPLPITHFLEHEEEIRLGSLKFSVIHTPGHSPGSLCLRLNEDSALGIPETVFTGDTLFQGSVGRTDLWGADGDLMFKMIRSRVLNLDGDTRVCPGHGPDSKIAIEKKSNPFLL